MICLYKKLYGTGDVKEQKKWWDYVDKIGDTCQGEVSESCSMMAHKSLGLDWGQT